MSLMGCDGDGDGYSKRAGDCDDDRADVFPDQREVCDGIDNNCDGAVDEGSFEEEVCDGIDNNCDGAVDEGPFAEEACDGVDNDCDDIVDEDTFVFISSAGVTSILSPGTMDVPSQIDITEDGQISICETIYANINIHGVAVDITGASEFASIDGAAFGSVVHIFDDSNVKIRDLTIRNGSADICAFHPSQPTWYSGGGICCESSILEMTSLVIASSTAITGGGFFSNDCDVTGTGLVIDSNESLYYGGGLVAVDGSVEIIDSSFTSNVADPTGGFGGAFFVGRTTESADNPFLFRGSEIIDNFAFYGGGGVVGGRSYVKCIDSNGIGGFTKNRATSGGGAVLLTGSSSFIESIGCSWGVGDSNNYSESGATDIGSENLLEGTKDFGDNETFTCSDTVCPQ